MRIKNRFFPPEEHKAVENIREAKAGPKRVTIPELSQSSRPPGRG
jgi:hypothetical protein